MNKNNFVPFSKPSLSNEEEKAIKRVLHSGWLTTGKETLEFEKEFAKKVNSKYAFAVNSASSGLILAMDAVGIKQGTKILTSPYTFISTATSAIHLGGDVVYVDIEKDSYSIDPYKIEEALQNDVDKTIKAIVPIHIAGNICNMKRIIEIAKKYNVAVIEDAAHAFPSVTCNGYAGTLGDIGVFSFYATKTMTTAEGGMVCTNNDEYAKRISIMRMHGIDRPVWNRYTSDKASWEYDVIEPGFKFNLPDILSCIGRVQLKKSDTFLAKRVKIVKKYLEAFSDLNFIECPPDSDGNAWHLFIIRLKLEKLKCTRNEFSKLLQDSGIGISMHFIPHYHFTYWKNRNIDASQFPEAEKKFEASITLPLWPDMTNKMINQVIQTVIKLGKEYHV